MSWSVSASGRPLAIADTITQQFDEAWGLEKVRQPHDMECLALARRLVEQQISHAISVDSDCVLRVNASAHRGVSNGREWTQLQVIVEDTGLRG